MAAAPPDPPSEGLGQGEATTGGASWSFDGATSGPATPEAEPQTVRIFGVEQRRVLAIMDVTYGPVEVAAGQGTVRLDGGLRAQGQAFRVSASGGYAYHDERVAVPAAT